MPILLSENPGEFRIFETDDELVQSISSSAKVGPPIPEVEHHPIQHVGPNVTHDGQLLPRVVTTVTATTDMTMQAISNRFMSLLPTMQSIPAWSDDITHRFGPEIYDRMIKDSEVSASLNTLVSASTSQNVRFVPAVNEGEPGHVKSRRIADFFTWMVDEYMDGPSFDAVRIASIISALQYGNSVTEMNFGVVPDGRFKNFIAVQSVRDADVKEYSYVVDNFNNTLGIIPSVNRFGVGTGTEQITGSFFQSPTITIDDMRSSDVDKQKLINHFRRSLIPRKKFILYSWRPRSNDPRGTSILRPAYSGWWLKQQVINEMLAWVEKFAQPSVVGITPEGAQDICEHDANGEVISRISPTEQLLKELHKLQKSSAIAAPFGTNISLLQSSGQGQVFLMILQYANQEISRAILNQHLATSEGIHQSRAASTVHQDILSLVISSIKEWQKRILERDFVIPLIERNFGRSSLSLMPKIDIGDGDGFPLNPFEVSQLQGVQWFSPSQFAEIDRLLGLPIREESPEEILAHFGGSLQEDEAVFDEPGAQQNQLVDVEDDSEDDTE